MAGELREALSARVERLKHHTIPHPCASAVGRQAAPTPAPIPERLFAAWTEPAQLMQWWGPAQVSCPRAEVDLRVGGRYRIDNQLPDGRTLAIVGVFEEVSPPTRLVYSWSLDVEAAEREGVTVRFEPAESGTEVIVVHERIATEAKRDEHEHGWLGCLDGLVALVAARAG